MRITEWIDNRLLTCGQASPGTEGLTSYCEHLRWHPGLHGGQYGERWDDKGHTDIVDCLPARVGDPRVLLAVTVRPVLTPRRGWRTGHLAVRIVAWLVCQVAGPADTWRRCRFRRVHGEDPF